MSDEQKEAGNDGFAESDPNFETFSIFDLFARVPHRKALASELRKIQPTKLGVGASDLEACDRVYTSTCNEADAVISTYLQALRDAESNPHILSFTEACLSHALALGPKTYRAWQNAPQSGLDGLSPKEWCKANGFYQLAHLLFDYHE